MVSDLFLVLLSRVHDNVRNECGDDIFEQVKGELECGPVVS